MALEQSHSLAGLSDPTAPRGAEGGLCAETGMEPCGSCSWGLTIGCEQGTQLRHILEPFKFMFSKQRAIF